jgi:hypothetical protein
VGNRGLSQAAGGGSGMTTRDTINSYFNGLEQKSGWEAFLADEMTFTSFVSPIKRVAGRGAYLEATEGGPIDGIQPSSL